VRRGGGSLFWVVCSFCGTGCSAATGSWLPYSGAIALHSVGRHNPALPNTALHRPPTPPPYQVRVHTLALPITQSLGTTFRGADLDAYMSYVSRKVASQVS